MNLFVLHGIISRRKSAEDEELSPGSLNSGQAKYHIALTVQETILSLHEKCLVF